LEEKSKVNQFMQDKGVNMATYNRFIHEVCVDKTSCKVEKNRKAEQEQTAINKKQQPK